MAIFGRKTARQRLRRATRESLTIPAFSSPIDCTPWVIGGLWPAELATTTPETAVAADYLKADLQRIVVSANEELQAIRRTMMPEPVRQAEEARVINTARGFAVRRVESAVRQLHTAGRPRPPEHRRAEAPETAVVIAEPAGTSRHDAQRGRHAAVLVPPPDAPRENTETGRHAESEPKPEQLDSDVTAVADATSTSTGPDQFDQGAVEVVAEPGTSGWEIADPVARPDPPEPDLADALGIETADQKPAAVEACKIVTAAVLDPEAETERLWRLLKFVARQEPGLRWAAGQRKDGTTIVVTDLAHGWVPPGIALPADVRLLEPDRRSGNATALLGPSAVSVSYAPGDPLGWATDSSAIEASPHPRELPMVDDLGWVLSEATHWRDGLPRMVHTLAKAGAAGTGVMEAEVDVLRVHLDTARYQLLAQYPDVDSALLLNCLLLAAAEGIATEDKLSANYHFAWFQRLNTPPASTWVGEP